MTRTSRILAMLGLLIPAGAQAEDEEWNAAWFPSLARAESLVSAAIARGMVDAGDQDAVVAQMRHGALALRAMLGTTIGSDTLIAGPLLTPPAPARPQGRWGDRFVRATHMVAVTTHLINIGASLQGGNDDLRRTLAYVGGGVGGAGTFFNIVRPRSRPTPGPDPNERIRTVSREWVLRETCAETGRVAMTVLTELRAISAAPCSTRAQTIAVTRRYASAVERAGAVLDWNVAHAASTLKSCSDHTGFSAEARARMVALADRFDRLTAQWQTRRWMFARSERNALGWLVIADRP